MRLASAINRLADKVGRQEPPRIGSRRSGARRLPFDVWAKAAPGLAQPFNREVPQSYWVLTNERDDATRHADRAVAEVSCPCGEKPLVEAGTHRTCECERAYVFDGDSMRVANSPARSTGTSEA